MITPTTAREGRPPAIVWSVAGFDPSSGAGVTADLMTFASHGLFGCSAITALTVQTTAGVFASEPIRPELLEQTLERLYNDLPAVGVKIGVLATPELARVVARFLEQRRRANAPSPLVVFDPVLVSSSGRALYPASGLHVLREQLLPLVDWLTPNWAELSVLSGVPVGGVREAEEAARCLAGRHPGLSVVATGGDREVPADLMVGPDGEALWIQGRHVPTTSTHGTGCAFSSALLAHLLRGSEPVAAVRGAKAFVEGALRHAPGVGKGRGPMGLLWPLERLATLEG